jgi:hypothetical protein
MRLRRPSSVSVVAVAVCLLGIAGFAYATIPDSGGKQRSTGPGDDHVLTAKTLVLTDGQRKKLFEHGPFKLVGVCDLDHLTADGNRDEAQIIIRTAQDHSAVTDSFSGADFMTSERLAILRTGFEQPDEPRLSSREFTAIAADRTTILRGELWGGMNVLGRTDRCRFGGHFFTE